MCSRGAVSGETAALWRLSSPPQRVISRQAMWCASGGASAGCPYPSPSRCLRSASRESGRSWRLGTRLSRVLHSLRMSETCRTAMDRGIPTTGARGTGGGVAARGVRDTRPRRDRGRAAVDSGLSGGSVRLRTRDLRDLRDLRDGTGARWLGCPCGNQTARMSLVERSARTAGSSPQTILAPSARERRAWGNLYISLTCRWLHPYVSFTEDGVAFSEARLARMPGACAKDRRTPWSGRMGSSGAIASARCMTSRNECTWAR